MKRKEESPPILSFSCGNRRITCLCLPRSPRISLFSPLRDFRDAVPRAPGSVGLGRRGGESPEFDGAYRTRALSPSCRSALEISVCPFDRSVDRSLVRAVLLFCGSREVFLSRNGRAIAKTERRNGMSRRDRPLRRYAVRSTGLLKARSKA